MDTPKIRPDNEFISPAMVEIEHDGKRWKPFPVFVLESEDDAAIVPNQRHLQYEQEKIGLTEEDVALGAGDSELKKRLVEQAVNRFARMVEISSYRRTASVRRYYLAKPSFGDFLQADENSRSYVNGIGTPDRNLLMRNLLPKRVLQEFVDASSQGRTYKVFTLEDIMGIDIPEIGIRLFEEVYAMSFPDASRIPFWRESSMTSPGVRPSEQGAE